MGIEILGPILLGNQGWRMVKQDFRAMFDRGKDTRNFSPWKNFRIVVEKHLGISMGR